MAKLIKPLSAKEISDIISLPEVLTSEDGRKFKITFWEPKVQLGFPITVKIEAYIEANKTDS